MGDTTLTVHARPTDLAKEEVAWELPEDQLSLLAPRIGGWQASPRAGGSRIAIENNVIAQRHKAGTKVNPVESPMDDEATYHSLADKITYAISVSGKANDLLVHRNHIYRATMGLAFDDGDSSPENMSFQGNLVRRCGIGLVILATADGSGATIVRGVVVSDNIFDMDPFHESSQRSRTDTTYGWKPYKSYDDYSSSVDAMPIQLEGCRGVVITNNVIRNAHGLFAGDGSSTPVVGRNFFYAGTVGSIADPSSPGVYDPNGAIEIHEVGDPQTVDPGSTAEPKPTFGEVDDVKSRFALSQPPIEVGKWRTGERVYSCAPATTGAVGWVCTDGATGTFAMFGAI